MRLLRDDWGDIHPLKAIFWVVLLILILGSSFWYFSIATQEVILIKTISTTMIGKYKYEETVSGVSVGNNPGIVIPIKTTVYVIYLDSGDEVKVSYDEWIKFRPDKPITLYFWRQGWYEWKTWKF